MLLENCHWVTENVDFSLKFALVFVAVIGVACARGGSGEGHHGGGSGEHGGKSCVIAPAGTTNCTGVTGANCSDAANLAVSWIFRKAI
jgi:hypothetical protein